MDGVLVYVRGRGGRGKVEHVYFCERTHRALEEYLRVRSKDGCGALFLSTGGGGLSVSATQDVLKRLARKAGFKGRANPHAFSQGWAR